MLPSERLQELLERAAQGEVVGELMAEEYATADKERPLGPEMEADYQQRKARFYATFEKKRQEAEALFKKYEEHFRDVRLPLFKPKRKDDAQ